MRITAPKAEISAEQQQALARVLGRPAWKRIRSAIMIQNSFRCAICRQQFGASNLIVKHLSRPGVERPNELKGLILFCVKCLD